MKSLVVILMMFGALQVSAHNILSPLVKTLQVYVGDDWKEIPLLRKGDGDVLNVSFDLLTHQYHRLTYSIEHMEYDWTPSSQLMESDYIIGTNNNPIEDYDLSRNTNTLYTHYLLEIPNERVQVKLSGNYRLTIKDEDDGDNIVATVDFMVFDNQMAAGIGVTSNTDIDINKNHQQAFLTVNYSGVKVNNPREQIHTVVMQNGINGLKVTDAKPDIIKADGMEWKHVKELIFDAGNEYHKFEILSTDHVSYGIDDIKWDGKNWHAFPLIDNPRPNYIYDEDANGAFFIRNSDDLENDLASEYMMVNYRMKSPEYAGYEVFVNGNWTNGQQDEYLMTYDKASGMYKAQILQKQGYYNYRYMMKDSGGNVMNVPSQGSFYETENGYVLLVYYKEQGGRYDQLVGFAELLE